ncbi:ATP-binding protein [Deinococcus oregonensis]|uniref:histidine kinase n=1 Tax=Deinococcus oregonensis TaxID=1805970 RepID=A0ABV6B6L1_9DEIO
MLNTDLSPHAPKREMFFRVRDFDWSSRPLGAQDGWPRSLRTVTEMLLAHPFAMIVLWGPDLIQIYNDAYRVIMGRKHPAGLGEPTRDCWSEVWAFNAPIYQRVMESGESFEFSDQPFTIHRCGDVEQAFFTLSYSPVRDDDGGVGGVLVTVIETTARVHAERAAREHQAEVESRNQALEAFVNLTRDLTLSANPYALIRQAQDIVLSLLPEGFVLYYELEGAVWRLKSQVGDLRNPSLQATIDQGLPYKTAQNLVRPWLTRTSHYQNDYDKTTDQLQAEQVAHVHATATLPLLVRGEPRGVFAAVMFNEHRWTGTDKAVLDTVVRSLGLALEGAQSLVQLTEERRKLEAVNEELEAFSYSVSHDLRTPVRHILGFNALLRRALNGQLNEQAERYLSVIEQAARRMNTLIDALLELSHTARLPLQDGVVDLGDLAQAIVTELEADALNRQVEWQLAPLPLVVGDSNTLRQVLVNLLSNALKYTRTRDVAQIRVWAEERPEEWEVFVGDNGVGFDPRYADKLFGVFQRLHRQDEFEGTGVGLANVRRIVTRHGGQVKATGQPDQGATFSLTLPKQPRLGG